MVVLVTGANGQLGQSLQFISSKYSGIKFVFCDSSQLDITNADNVNQVFNYYKPDFCVNAAAYTAVDKAETETAKAHLVNVIGPKNLAESCLKFDVTLIHISTDFVFDGNSQMPYKEDHTPNPTGVYGQTKLEGEKTVQSILENHIIIRTSWVYSQFGNNFMKTMIRLGNEKDVLSVVNDQIGTPTNAVDLAKAIVKIIECRKLDVEKNTEEVSSNKNILQSPNKEVLGGPSKIYNFSNEGQCSWYDFAKKIFEINHIQIDLKPIPSTNYPTPAKRPSFSVLDKSKIKSDFNIEIKNWEESLKSVAFL